MIDKSIYESGHPMREANDNAICFGLVTAVDVTTRFCSVKTFFATNPALNDQHIKSCQWLSADASPYGDDMTSVPRVNSIALVFFVQGEAFIFGFFRGTSKTGSVAGGASTVPLAQGDKIIATKAGNFITVKSNGLIQIQCKDTLRSLYLPNNSEWLNLCRQFELKTDGGYIFWRSDDDLNTLHKAVYRKDMAQSFVVTEEKGSVSSSVIYRIGIGPGAAKGSANSYEHSVTTDGTSTLTIGTFGVPAYTSVVKPDGSATITARGDVALTSSAGKVSVLAQAGDIDVKATTGAIKAEATAGDISLKADAGAINVVATAGDISVKAVGGNIAMEGSLGRLKLGGGQVGLGGPGAEVVDAIIQTLDLLIKNGNAMLAMTVIGNLGYSTSPPVNSADFADITVKAAVLKAKVTAIKGGT